MSARAGFVAIIALGAGVVGACREPSEIVLVVTTNAVCSDVTSTSVVVGNLGDIEHGVPSATKRGCDANATIGSVVLAPSGGDGDPVAFKVVSGIRQDAESCIAPDYKGCIVARRALSYVPHTQLRIEVFIDLACKDVPCGATDTCSHGECVPANVDPGQCISPAGCGEGVLGDGGPREAGADAGDATVDAGDAGVDTSVDAPADQSVDAPADQSVDAPADQVADAPADAPADSVVDAPLDALADAPFDAGCTTGASRCAANIVQTCSNGAWSSTTTCAIACSDLAQPAVCVTPDKLTLGLHHTCALMSNATVRCWGDNTFGQLGIGVTNVGSTKPLELPLQNIAQIAAGANHTCARTASNTVLCWGDNSLGQIGVGSMAATFPSPTPLAATSVVQIAANGDHTCMRGSNAVASCWGANTHGEVGNGSFVSPVRAPTPVAGLGVAEFVAAGVGHSCAMPSLPSTSFACWGQNDQGQLGNGGTMNENMPQSTLVTGGALAIQIALGAKHSCYVSGQARVWCWGSNANGQFGNGLVNALPTSSATNTTVSGVQELALGANHTCAITQAGDVSCWGANNVGQVGNGTMGANVLSPAPALTGMQVIALAAGGDHTCARVAAGPVSCWGANGAGQGGDGTRTNRSAPTPVVW